MEAGQAAPADLVLTGCIYAGQGKVAQAMAVTGERFVYVGSREGVNAYIGEHTKVLDAGQGMVLAGMTEGHAHVTTAYEVLHYALLSDGESVEDYIAILREFLEKHPDIKVLMARGYRNGAFDKRGAQASVLDTVSRNIPIVAVGEDSHSMWVNTKAMELAGLDKTNKAKGRGIVVRDAGGRPTGWLKEAAQELMRPLIPPLECEKLKEAILYYQNLALANGITHVFEPLYHPNQCYDACCQAYEELAREKQLLIRYQVGYTIEPAEDIDAGIAFAKERRARARAIGNDCYELNTIKLFIDGVLEGHTACLSQPYADAADTCGEPLWTQERCEEVVRKAVEHGFNVHMHTIGDGALAMAIQAFQAADGLPVRNRMPHAVTHVQVVEEHQFDQLAKLGVAVVVNPYWHFRDTLYFETLERPYLGEERAEAEYPLASFVRAGCCVSQASDYPVTIVPDSMASLHIMVNRRPPGDETTPALNGGEAVDVQTALDILTLNGAKQGGIDNCCGMITSGSCADFVIVDTNLLECPPQRLYQAKVQAVYRKGVQVYINSKN